MTRTLIGAALMRRYPVRCGCAGIGSRMVSTAPLRSVRLAARSCRAWPRRSRGRSRARARCRRGHDRPSARDRTCRRCCSRSPAECPSPSSMTCSDDVIAVAPALDRDRGVGGRIFRGIVEQIEQHLLEQHGIELEHRQIGGELQLDLVLRRGSCRRAAARCRRSRRDRAARCSARSRRIRAWSCRADWR